MKTLSRSEMKGLMGGLAPSSGLSVCSWDNNDSNPACTNNIPPTYYYGGSSGITEAQAQANADSACAASDCCNNVICGSE